MKPWMTIIALLLVAGQMMAEELLVGEQGTITAPMKGYVEVYLGVAEKRRILFPTDRIRLVRSGVENLPGALNEIHVQSGSDTAPLLVIKVEDRIVSYTAIRDTIGRAGRP